MPKPIYIIGHNPNTIDDVKEYLINGANAIEPDINVVKGTNRLCISHNTGDGNTIDINDYFSQINQFKNLSLVYLDCKPPIVNRAEEILQYVRSNLSPNIKIVLSVASIKEAQVMFPPVALSLKNNEYLLIDEENDPVAVSKFFKSIGAPRFGYGNGDSVPLLPTTIFFPHIEKSIRTACWLRDRGELGFVFTWTFNSKINQKFYLNIGVDGMIVDLKGFPCIPGLNNIKSVIAGSKNNVF